MTEWELSDDKNYGKKYDGIKYDGIKYDYSYETNYDEKYDK
jgi:hypothetical protein